MKQLSNQREAYLSTVKVFSADCLSVLLAESCRPVKIISTKQFQCALAFAIIIFLSACESDRFTSCERVSDIPEIECEALVTFYESTDGAHWKDQRGWLESRNPCEWHGVICTDGHVTGLALNYNEIYGRLPGELGNLSEMQLLNLYYNHLSGSIPSELGKLGKLEVLLLYNNQLSGPMPVELGQLVELRRLDLESNELSGEIPSEIGDLAELEALILGDNQLSGSIPAELGRLTKLRSLFLSTNNLSGVVPAELENLEELVLLGFYGNPELGDLPPDLAGVSRSPIDNFGWGSD